MYEFLENAIIYTLSNQFVSFYKLNVKHCYSKRPCFALSLASAGYSLWYHILLKRITRHRDQVYGHLDFRPVKCSRAR